MLTVHTSSLNFSKAQLFGGYYGHSVLIKQDMSELERTLQKRLGRTETGQRKNPRKRNVAETPDFGWCTRQELNLEPSDP